MIFGCWVPRKLSFLSLFFFIILKYLGSFWFWIFFCSLSYGLVEYDVLCWSWSWFMTAQCCSCGFPNIWIKNITMEEKLLKIMKIKLNMLLYISFFSLLEIINELFFNEQDTKMFYYIYRRICFFFTYIWLLVFLLSCYIFNIFYWYFHGFFKYLMVRKIFLDKS